VYHNSIPKKQ